MYLLSCFTVFQQRYITSIIEPSPSSLGFNEGLPRDKSVQIIIFRVQTTSVSECMVRNSPGGYALPPVTILPRSFSTLRNIIDPFPRLILSSGSDSHFGPLGCICCWSRLRQDVCQQGECSVAQSGSMIHDSSDVTLRAVGPSTHSQSKNPSRQMSMRVNKPEF